MNTKTFYLIALLSFSLSSNAAFLDKGDYFADTDSGLDWLKLDQTFSAYSYNAMILEQGDLGAFQGWIYASFSQINSLFDNAGGAGVYDGQAGWNTTQAVAQALAQVWVGGNGQFQRQFITGESPSNNGRHAVGEINSLSYNNGLAYMFSGLNHGEKRDNSIFAHSHALVRVSNVPEPSVITLFAVGILGLGFVRRRKLRQS